MTDGLADRQLRPGLDGPLWELSKTAVGEGGLSEQLTLPRSRRRTTRRMRSRPSPPLRSRGQRPLPILPHRR